MKLSNYNILALLEASFLFQATAAPVSPHLESRAPKFANIFAFGNSYTTNGFDYKGAQPNAGNLIGNPDAPGLTTSGGPNWVEDVITADSSSPLLLYDIAVGGATVDNTFVAASTGVSTFIEQAAGFVSTYGPNTAGATLWNSANSLFTVWFGINDVSNGYTNANYETLVQTVMGNYFDQVANLYAAGARNFLILGVPPFQLTPNYVLRGEAAQAAAAKEIAYYNQLLQNEVKSFKDAHSDATVWYLDTIPIFDQALENPTEYGSPDAVCINPDGVSCLWWNDFHPGQAIHKLVSQAVVTLTGA